MPADPAPAVEVSAVGVARAGRVILDGLTFAAQRGRITALLGANGAGKTTLLRCLTGLITPDAGTITVLGGAPAAAIAAGRLAHMPQHIAAWSGIAPMELLRYLAGLHSTPLDPRRLAAELGIDRFAQTAYRRLSGGEQQALNLAGAIIGRPEVVLLDEPTAGMDVHLRRRVWTLLERLRAAGVSVLLTTHDMAEAARLADEIAIIDHGRISAMGSLATLTRGVRNLEDVFCELTAPGLER